MPDPMLMQDETMAATVVTARPVRYGPPTTALVPRVDEPSPVPSRRPTRCRIPIAADADVLAARQAGQRLASQLAFSRSDLTFISAAIHEVARNIVAHAARGEVCVCLAERDGRLGIVVVAEDAGPGIADVRLALEEGYSTCGRLGLGLAGARRLMDDFEIASAPGRGTRVTMRKWIH
jgi:serine/threonine-protein kinase RsbT